MHADERGWGERAYESRGVAVTGLRMQDWFEESESVGRRIVESDDRVASTERITEAASPDWAVTLHDGRRVTAEITLMTEPGMNLQQERLATGRQRSPGGRWFLDVCFYSNDPPSLEDDEAIKKALRKIIGPEAPAVAARLEDRYGGVAEMREWQPSHSLELPPWDDEAQALCDEVLCECVSEVPGFAAVCARPSNKIELLLWMLTNSPDAPGVYISPLRHVCGLCPGDLSDLRNHAQRRIDSKSAKPQSLHPGEKWLVALCAHPLLAMMMRYALGGDGAPIHDGTLAPLAEIRLGPFDEVWIAAPLNSEGGEARTVKLARWRAPLVAASPARPARWW